MKKIVYLLSALMLAFTACDPMEDVYEELDKVAAGKADETDVVTTLASADYKLLKDVPAYITTKYYFATEDEAIQYIPTILAKKYPHLGNGADAFVTFKLQVYPGLSTTVAGSTAYTATADDYKVTGERFANFNSPDDMTTFLGVKYPDAPENQVVIFTYDYFANSVTSTVTDAFYKKNGAWVNIYYVTPEDYASVGKKSDFNSSDNALFGEYFNKFLSNKVFGAQEEDLQYVSYGFYNSTTRVTEQRVMAMGFNGSKWVVVDSNVTKDATFKFNKVANEWNVDFTIEYTLVNADYDWIGKTNPNPNYGTADNRANLAQYRSYYVEKQDNRYWSQEDIEKSLLALAEHLFPNPKKGVKYKLNYKIYNAATITVSIVVKKDETGKYVVDK
ncbi:hypothetical protein H7F15_17730 [Pontibacter sp. Tf4]|uniref:hypothetical protein n=1 Tax=Pontibacter sp. Tf4 TaxID=2761620 RepID=UPI001623ABB7|nr:hypothetical protein [Pontibacter sp. Tf4]MBB6612886.1 hypothetical protein [Pontibacter sp. Tf4]